MPDYFSYFPKIYIDVAGNGNSKVVTNLLKRIQIKQGLKEVAAVFDEYTIDTATSPEVLSEQYYGDQKYYWVILMFNNIKDRFYDWPLTADQFEQYVNDKYSNINAVHHYEIAQSSGETTSYDNSHLIQVNSGTSGATAITNYEYEQRIQDKKRRIRLLRPEYLEMVVSEFIKLMEA